jgi:hypothetical protein
VIGRAVGRKDAVQSGAPGARCSAPSIIDRRHLLDDAQAIGRKIARLLDLDAQTIVEFGIMRAVDGEAEHLDVADPAATLDTDVGDGEMLGNRAEKVHA